jgi:hypothetical protein
MLEIGESGSSEAGFMYMTKILGRVSVFSNFTPVKLLHVLAL